MVGRIDNAVGSPAAPMGYYRHPDHDGREVHDCGYTLHEHGWLVVGDDGITVCPASTGPFEGQSITEMGRRPVTSLLEGASQPSAPNVEVATPGEFAARWNEADEEQRQAWLRSMRQESERAALCRMQHDGRWVPAGTSVRDIGALVQVDPGRC